MERAPGEMSENPEAVVERIRARLAQALASDAGGADGRDADAETLDLLRRLREPDRVLERLDLDDLASLAERIAGRLATARPPAPTTLRRMAWDLLDLVRRSTVLCRIPVEERETWASRILDLVERSDLTVGPLFRMRAEAYGSRPLFQVSTALGARHHSWRRVAARVETLGRGLLSLGGEGESGTVAIVSENRLEVALADLACLTSGIVNVPVPANATATDVGYILGHSKAATAIVSDREQLHKVLRNRDALPDLRHVIVMNHAAAGRDDVMTLDDLAARSGQVSAAELMERSLAVRIGDPATTMYTSGTTGMPKGIRFSHRNVVFKRFARALALPEIGERDVFLCYLPLYHTFGRFLEMLGCVFWGATYCFLETPSADGLVRGMQRCRPTVFISVPQKWMQLHEAITQAAPLDKASDDEILEATRRLTGGRLRWGLSAAGHLDSEIFRFFQRQGTELMSGFGMTEGTGGITMTPPGGYKDDSLGVPLPGIEARLLEDGELVVRGPYVMMGYMDPPDGEPSFDDDGWLHTGDLMQVDTEGYLRLIDRKKEIYKNVKGQTIAPQRVENLFRDFESVGRVFLVGDHRGYNTALIHPNPNYQQLDLGSLDPAELKDHFRSLVVSVNKFLAPYERIVDFAVIDRDLDPERGELTPKGTPRRKTVERNFAEIIRLLYRRTSLQVGNLELTLPNWLFQALGLTADDIEVSEDRIVLRTTGLSLTVQRVDDRIARIGECLYRHPPGPINLGDLLTTPRLWLGNQELVELVDLDLPSRQRPRAGERLKWESRAGPARLTAEHDAALREAVGRAEQDLMDLHVAALALESPDEEAAASAMRLVEIILEEEEGALAEPARLVLVRAAASPSVEVRRRAFQVLVQAEKDSRFPATLRAFMSAPGLLLDEETRALVCERDVSDSKLDAFIRIIGELEAAETIASMLKLLAEYGSAHPTRYRRLRAFLIHTMLFSEREEVRREASLAAAGLQEGFRRWLGGTQRIAVDPETNHEYRWQDVVAFDDNVPETDRQRLISAIQATTFLREAVFLFSKGATVRLSDIPPGGIWIRLLGSLHGKSVYRITIQTRFQGSYEVAVNVNQELGPKEVEEEIQWLILCGESGDRDPLVEDFGGYWPEQDLWSEEFIPGETLDRGLRRLARRADEVERFQQRWPFFAWSALSAYVDFWNRTGRRWEISKPAAGSVIVPTHDYLTGARLVSVSARRPFTGLIPMMHTLRAELVEAAEKEYPALAGIVGRDLIFSSLLEVVGEEEGVALLRESIEDGGEAVPEDLRAALDRYLSAVEAKGFLPMRLFFASQRYRRWSGLTGEHTARARARTMRELYEDYGLGRLSGTYPEARARFFRETVFHDASEPLAEGLEEIIGRLRRRQLVGDELIDAIADLRARSGLGSDEDYFLARLSFPHLRPEDAAGFVQTDLAGRPQSEMVVSLEDHEGIPFLVRHALNPKEVGRLHRLFLEANLDVRFRPEHQYLVALSDRQQIIGGIYYEIEEEGISAHLEKIVVAERYRNQGVANGLMNELFNRLRAAGIKTVTTGFYRPEYFYTFGFAIEKRYAGLVKSLEEGAA